MNLFMLDKLAEVAAFVASILKALEKSPSHPNMPYTTDRLLCEKSILSQVFSEVLLTGHFQLKEMT